MHGIVSAPAEITTKITRTVIRTPEQKFGRVARALWPRKTAAELAARAGVTQRAAEFWIAGHREPSARALAVVIAEMLA